jgi:hypothetical protein
MGLLQPFRARDLPARGVDDYRASLRDHEVKLTAAKKQRDVIQIDRRKATLAVDLGDQRARLELRNLHKSDDAIARLITSLETQIIEARKRLAMAETQVATVAAKRAESDAPAVPHDRLFEVVCPDGRVVRHHHASAGELQKALQPGYRVTAEVFGAGIDGKGGMVEPLGQSTMKTLLAAHGGDPLAWLEAQGFQRNGG